MDQLALLLPLQLAAPLQVNLELMLLSLILAQVVLLSLILLFLVVRLVLLDPQVQPVLRELLELQVQLGLLVLPVLQV